MQKTDLAEQLRMQLAENDDIPTKEEQKRIAEYADAGIERNSHGVLNRSSCKIKKSMIVWKKKRSGRRRSAMGIYLNPASTIDTYLREVNSPYFVDKSMILEELIPRISTNMNYICITRPRRFGKTVMANLIASFFQRKAGEGTVFDSLKIASSEQYRYPADQYDVIFISLNELPRKCRNYGQYIDRIEERLLTDLLKVCPEAEICMEDAVWDALSSVYNVRRRSFVFILDEWDYIFHRDFVTEEDKKDYIDFLSNLLKGKAYAALTYMTGILPIAKYSSGSELMPTIRNRRCFITAARLN